MDKKQDATYEAPAFFPLSKKVAFEMRHVLLMMIISTKAWITPAFAAPCPGPLPEASLPRRGWPQFFSQYRRESHGSSDKAASSERWRLGLTFNLHELFQRLHTEYQLSQKKHAITRASIGDLEQMLKPLGQPTWR